MPALKDQINRAAIERLADALSAVEPTFPAAAFIHQAVNGLEERELKARVAHVADALGAHLPSDFVLAADVVCRAVEEAGPWGDFDLWPVQHWAMTYGLDHADVALPLIRTLTSHFSGEFAVRPFIDRDPDGLAAVLERWARDPDEHVRRLASEGSRPRLPWGPRLAVPPGWASPILDVLHDDTSEYVRRSVANHLNDISYSDADLAVATASRWSVTPGPHTAKVVRHGLRSLVKRGHPAALALLGADPDARLAVDRFEVTPGEQDIGGHVTMTLSLRSDEPTKHHVVIDYRVLFVGAREATNAKTFRWRSLDLAPSATVDLVKRHAFRNVSIRTHRPGPHTIEVQVNGRVAAAATVMLRSTGM